MARTKKSVMKRTRRKVRKCAKRGKHYVKSHCRGRRKKK